MMNKTGMLVVLCSLGAIVSFIIYGSYTPLQRMVIQPLDHFKERQSEMPPRKNELYDSEDGDTDTDSANNKHSHKILWYNPSPHVKSFPEAMYAGFSSCHFSNCEMSFNKRDHMKSDAIIFDGREMRSKQAMERPLGQIWIFAAEESPLVYGLNSKDQWKKEPWRHSYNWTMTYNKINTDIHLPYGVLKKKKTNSENRNYTSIASKKNDSVLMIASHCSTYSKRQEYVNELRKYLPVTILGSCGTSWKCGKRYVHDDCFDVLNTTYKFYLAFENALCTQYFTEKFFENYNYDIIMVVRGGNETEEPVMSPSGTFISSRNFKSPKDLGKYLKALGESTEDYAKMLERKSMYYSPGYKEVYQKAMCELCKRMNFQDKYQKTIENIEDWAFKGKPCVIL